MSEDSHDSISLQKTKQYLEWLKTKLYLDKISINASKRKVRRGQVYWCHFGIGIGNEMSKETSRPCVIVQNDIGNTKSPNTVVVPITHDLDAYPCLVPFPPQYNKDGKKVLDGKINVSNIVCIAKSRLGDPILKDGEIIKLNMKEVDAALAIEIGIMWRYADLKDRLDKLEVYNKRVKQERNEVQDLLVLIRNELKVKDNTDILASLKSLQNKST